MSKKFENLEKFNPQEWLEKFKVYSAKGDSSGLHRSRINIFSGTKEACEKGFYIKEDGIKVDIYSSPEQVSDQAKRTKLVDFSDENLIIKTREEFKPKNPLETQIKVVEGDCLEEALRLKELGLNPLVLNMACATYPGGGYESGAGAQEENLFRRTNYFQSLVDRAGLDTGRKWRYPLDEFQAVYSPEVLVLRGAESKGYPFLPAPVPMAFIALPAYKRPKTYTDQEGVWLSPDFADKTMKKMRVIFATALEHGHNSVVLSALGCGAYKNPPLHIARLFKQVITKDFPGCFRVISFAIINDHNSGKGHNPLGNFEPFLQTFKDFQDNSKTVSSTTQTTTTTPTPTSTQN